MDKVSSKTNGPDTLFAYATAPARTIRPARHRMSIADAKADGVDGSDGEGRPVRRRPRFSPLDRARCGADTADGEFYRRFASLTAVRKAVLDHIR